VDLEVFFYLGHVKNPLYNTIHDVIPTNSVSSKQRAVQNHRRDITRHLSSVRWFYRRL